MKLCLSKGKIGNEFWAAKVPIPLALYLALLLASLILPDPLVLSCPIWATYSQVNFYFLTFQNLFSTIRGLVPGTLSDVSRIRQVVVVF
jgi:hypothetical protein